MPRSIPEARVEVRLLIDELRKLEPGGVVTYDRLSEVAGGDVRAGSKLYSALGTARNRVERDLGYVLASVSGVGIKRLVDSETIHVLRQATEHVRKTTSKAMRRSATVDATKLTPEQQKEHFTRSSQLGVLDCLSRESSVRAIEGKVKQSGRLVSHLDVMRELIDKTK